MNGPGIASGITLLGDPAAIAAAWEARDTAPMERLARAAEIVIAARTPQLQTEGDHQ